MLRRLKRAERLLREREHLLGELTVHREELQAKNQALMLAEAELSSARDGFLNIYELAPVPYLTLTSSGVVAAVNISGARLFGRDANQIVGTPLAIRVAPQDRPRFRQHIARCLRQPDTAHVELTLRMAHGEGPVQLFTIATRSRRIYAAIVDLRERRQAEEERRALAVKAEAARAAAASRDYFLATLSHELRTPLAPAMLAVQALEQAYGGRGASTDTLFATVRRNLGYEVRLINDLLDVTRLTHQKLALEKRAIDLHTVVREAIDQLRGDAETKGVRVDAALDAPRSQVHGDPDRLVQVFTNLLRNAIKFTPQGGRVHVRSRLHNGDVAVEVRDTGPGIAPEDRARIFDAFAQGTRTGAREGLGLGLAIARGIVEAHDGRITVYGSGAGRGSSFVVLLPVLAGAQPAAAPPGPQEPGGDEDVPRPVRGKRILFVDDDRDTVETMVEILADSGYVVTVADSVASALKLIDEPVDVVISDIGLPDGSGLDLLRALRARRHVPAIALSGYGTTEDLIRSREAGFQQHLVKPVTLPDLLRAIETLPPVPS